MKKIFIFISLMLAVMLAVSSCSEKKEPAGSSVISSDVPSGDIPSGTSGHKPTLSYSQDINLDFSGSDVDHEIDVSSATTVNVSGDTVSITGKGATYADHLLKISLEGTYVLQGQSDDITVIISLSKKDKATIVLDGCDFKSNEGPAIYITEADKVFINCAKGSKNFLSDASSYANTYTSNKADACIFSKADLAINGKGSLTVNGNCKHGIVSKDNLIICGVMLDVSASSTGIEGKDCVKVSGADISISSKKDGLRSTNTENSSRGFVYIDHSDLEISCINDGIQAETLLMVSGSDISINTTSDVKKKDSESYKGLKSSLDVYLERSDITIISSDDCIHADETVVIDGGTYELTSNDDGIHADTDLCILDGDIDILDCYEGLEATTIAISGGYVSLHSQDDGINASGGSNTNGSKPASKADRFSCSKGSIIIDGGYVFVYSAGDGLDANGTITVNDGILIVSGPSQPQNGALDYDSSATINGGIVVATGSSGMAMNFSEANNQASIVYSFKACTNGTAISITDDKGSLILSFTPDKDYESVVFSSPLLQVGKTYKLVIGGDVTEKDKNGFSSTGTLTGGTELISITLDSSLYGKSFGFGPPGKK